RSLSIETRSPPGLLAPTLAAFTLITRTARACASYPCCVAVYPRDSRSRRVLCRSSHSLHSQGLVQIEPCRCQFRVFILGWRCGSESDPVDFKTVALKFEKIARMVAPSNANRLP